MSFTPEEHDAFEAIEKVIGEQEVSLKQVDKYSFDQGYYVEYAKKGLKEALLYYSLNQLASGVDWSEMVRLKREEEQRKLEERSAGVRDGVVIGALAGLLPKISKAFPGAETTFEVNSDGADLLVDNGADEIRICYSRSNRTVYTIVETAAWTDDVTSIQGSMAPRLQLKGFDAVLTYLESESGSVV